MSTYRHRETTEVPVYSSGSEADGGTGLFARLPNKQNFGEFGFDFRMLTSEMGYFQHGFPVQDPSVLDAREDGSKPTWIYAYCLASPTGQDVPVLEYDPTCIEECRSIIIPGTNIGLHDCEQIDGAVTEGRHRAIILNWTTGVVQIFDHRKYVWDDIFEVLNQTEVRMGEGQVDVRAYDWHISAEALRGAAPFKTMITPIVQSPYTSEQGMALIQKDVARWQKAQESFSPALTKEQIMDRIGASKAPVAPQILPPTVASETRGEEPDAFEDIFGDMPAAAPPPGDVIPLEQFTQEAQKKIEGGQL